MTNCAGIRNRRRYAPGYDVSQANRSCVRQENLHSSCSALQGLDAYCDFAGGVASRNLGRLDLHCDKCTVYSVLRTP